VGYVEVSLACESRARRARFESLLGPVIRHARQENTIAAADVEYRAARGVPGHKLFEFFVEADIARIIFL
jgi:hypothetical protein